MMRSAQAFAISAVILIPALVAFSDSNSSNRNGSPTVPLAQHQATAAGRAIAALPPTQSRQSDSLTSVTIEECMEVARDFDQDLFDRLCALEGQDPDGLERAMLTSARRLVALAELKQRHPDLYELKMDELRIDAKVTRLARRVRQGKADGSETGLLEQELRELVVQQVALSFKSRVVYYERLREHLESLKASIDQDAINFLDTVDRRVQQLLEGRNGPDFTIDVR